jgi:hypothetical protein
MRNMTPEESKMFAEFVRSEMSLNMHPGMSLRAYIATEAMQAFIVATTKDDLAKYSAAELGEAAARGACAYADALIAELGKEAK